MSALSIPLGPVSSPMYEIQKQEDAPMSHCTHDDSICKVPKLAPQMSEDLAVIRKQIEIYLGNGKPGVIPEEVKELREDLKELREEVKGHTAYINQQKGSTGTWATVRVVLVPIILSFITAAVTVWARSH